MIQSKKQEKMEQSFRNCGATNKLIKIWECIMRKSEGEDRAKRKK